MQIVSKREIAMWDSRHRKGGKPKRKRGGSLRGMGNGGRWKGWRTEGPNGPVTVRRVDPTALRVT